MERKASSLIALAVCCTFAAALFGFGANVFSWRSAYAGAGRESLIQATRLFVYVALGVLLAFRGGWYGIVAAGLMALAASTLEWALFPLSYDWAALEHAPEYARKLGPVSRPAYASWVAYDVLAVGISSALAQGLRAMAHVNPRGDPDG